MEFFLIPVACVLSAVAVAAWIWGSLKFRKAAVRKIVDDYGMAIEKNSWHLSRGFRGLYMLSYYGQRRDERDMEFTDVDEAVQNFWRLVDGAKED